MLHSVSTQEAYIQLARALRDEGNAQEALIQYDIILQKYPNSKEALFDLGALYYKQSNYSQSSLYLEKLLALEPSHFETIYYLALDHTHLGKHDKSIELYKKATTLKPQDAKLHLNLAMAYKKCNKTQESIDAFLKALSLQANLFDAQYNLACAYRDLKQYDLALEAYDKALGFNQNQFQILFEKANVLTNKGTPEDAIKIYSDLLVTAPANNTVLLNTAYAYKKIGQFDKACECYQKVLAVQPNNNKALVGIAYAYLTMGDFKNGFSTWMESNEKSSRLLKSKHEIKDKIIYIPLQWCFEDLLQFSRYAKLLKEYGAKVYLQVNYSLVPLLKNCPYIDLIIEENGAIPPFDYYIPLLGLPLLFETEVSTVPHAPYLNAPQELVQFWKSKMHNDHNYRIGIYYKSENPSPNLSENKNISLKHFVPFCQLESVSVYSLQTLNSEEINQLPSNIIINSFGSGFNAFYESLVNIAAVIENLDLVITNDSLIAHVAGGLGKKVFVGLPYRAEWRWMEYRSDSPWYPTMTLFRQKESGNWQTVVQDMVNTFTLLKTIAA